MHTPTQIDLDDNGWTGTCSCGRPVKYGGTIRHGVWSHVTICNMPECEREGTVPLEFVDAPPGQIDEFCAEHAEEAQLSGLWDKPSIT